MPPPEETPVEEIDALQRAIRREHGCESTWVRSVAVSEILQGQKEPAWVRIVELFALKNHAKAKECFAWSEPGTGKTGRRSFLVLRIPPIDDAADAVRASIVADYRADRIGPPPLSMESPKGWEPQKRRRDDGVEFEVRAEYDEDRFFGAWTCLSCGESRGLGSEDRNPREAMSMAWGGCLVHRCPT